MSYQSLINQLIHQGYLKTPRIIQAFKKIDRTDFLPANLKDEAGGNYPLSIGHGQTISQPLTVAFIIELLKPEVGDKILDVGSGSGWTTAILAEIVREKGKVYGLEVVPKLKEMGEENVRKYNFKNVKSYLGNGWKGLETYSPYDRILISAACPEIPQSLKNQLRIGGRIVAPVGVYSQSIVKLDKISKDKFKKEEHPGFVFVPLVKN